MARRNWLGWIPRLWANWLTLLGSVIASVAGLAIALFLLLDLVAPGKNAYTESFLILGLPMLFIFGLLLIPIGLWMDRRRRPLQPSPIEAAFQTALHDHVTRNRILFVAVATLVNVVLVGYAAESSIHYMDSPKFCGTACHSVMQPQWDAYRRSPHAKVDCVECHIGSSSYIKAKLNGVGQMWKLTTHTYHTPITMPVGKLLSSKQTCERCHSSVYVGNRLELYSHFAADQKNTQTVNALMLHIGGPNPGTGKYEGAHWHTNPDVEIRYEYLDEEREKIGKIDVYEKHALVASFVPPGSTGKALGERTMDCVDCHNRPTHVFDGSPKAAIDRALATGLLSVKVPFVAQMGAELLARSTVPRQGTEAFFRRELTESYHRAHPEIAVTGVDLDASAKGLANLYLLNVYPAMKLGWGTYRSNLSHQGDGNVGCFRCHDGTHVAKASDGTNKTLGQACDSCHEPIATGSAPAKLDDTVQLALPTSE